MIAEMPLEYASDRRHRERDKRPLMRVKALTGLNQSGAGDLHEVVRILAAIHEPPCQLLSQPQV